jgi:hypothetical protein
LPRCGPTQTHKEHDLFHRRTLPRNRPVRHRDQFLEHRRRRALPVAVARCRRGVDANITLPSLGPEVLALMEQGLAPADALDRC